MTEKEQKETFYQAYLKSLEEERKENHLSLLSWILILGAVAGTAIFSKWLGAKEAADKEEPLKIEKMMPLNVFTPENQYE